MHLAEGILPASHALGWTGGRRSVAGMEFKGRATVSK